METLTLTLKTTDKDLIKELRNIKDDNFSMSVFTRDQAYSIPPGITSYILHISSAFVAAIVIDILKKRLTTKPPHHTTINGINIYMNFPQINILVGNFFKTEKKN
jgi:uncharacterized UPF0146 family protein